ncbi:hypothetical protein HDU91_007452 [Kappamyces sp. JEL0680]|nr:hypothetical protein HDU91_007452 [Kappamyces sp. JEL0680]
MSATPSNKSLDEDQFNEAFLKMLDERNLHGAGRWQLLQLPLERKRMLMEQHEKEKKKSTSFWKRMSNFASGSGSSAASLDVEREFAALLSRLNYSEEDKSKLLKYSTSRKQDFIARYRAFQQASHTRGSASNPLSPRDDRNLDARSIQDTFAKMLDALDISRESRAILERKTTLEKRDMIADYMSRQPVPPNSSSGGLSDGSSSVKSRIHTPSEPARSSSVQMVPPKQSASVSRKPASLPPTMSSSAGNYRSGSVHSNQGSEVGVPASERRPSQSYPEKSPQWFTVQISNRNTSLKSLLRHLTALRVSFSLAGPRFIHEFVVKVVAHIGTNGISGIASLEIALDRVCAPYLQKRAKQRKRSIPSPNKPLPASPGPSSSPTPWYSDQVLPDEIRLETIKCVEIIMQTDFGMSCVLLSTGLIRQIIWCYSIPREEVQDEMASDPRLRRAHLQLLTLISQIMGPAALLDGGLKDVILTVMHELQRHQKEAYPFFYLVNSLQNPFSFNRANAMLEQSGALDPSYISDYGEIWNYRTQLVVFFNGIVSSGDTPAKRSRIRKVLESSGFKSITRVLLDQNPTEEFVAQVQTYNEDRQNDLRANEQEFRGNAAEMGTSIRNIEALFQAIQKLPDPEMINHFVQASFRNIEDIVRQLDGPASSDASQSKREDIGLVLNLVERTTRSLAISVRQFADETDKEKMAFLQQDFFDAANDLLGDSSKKKDASQKGKIGAIIEELDAIKQKYSDALKLQDAQQKEIDYLKLSLRSQFGLPGSAVPDYFDSESPSVYREYTRSYQNLDYKPPDGVLGLENTGTGIPVRAGPDLDQYLDEANNRDFWSNLNQKGSGAGLSEAPPDVPIGKLWQEVQRLRIHIKALEDEKKAFRLKEQLERERVEPEPVAALPPPPPPAPGMPAKMSHALQVHRRHRPSQVGSAPAD